MTLVDLADAADEGRFGGKAAELGAALRAGLPVPEGVALSATFLDDVLETGDARTALVERLQDLEAPYVVRSSGLAEDGASASFAGQHRTVVNVTDPGEVLDALDRVADSGRSEAAMAYREDRGIEAGPELGAVVQTLVDASKAGALFTRNPVDGSDERVVEAAWGLGAAVVDSKVTPDYFRVRPGGEVLERRVGSKDVRVIPALAGGTETAPVPDEKRDRLSLDDEELRALDALAARCESYRSGDHDIEWAFADGNLHLLQRRDITTA